MSNYWTGLSAEDAIALYQQSERDIVAQDMAVVEDACLDMIARVREAVSANLGNVLAEGLLIPRSYRAAALAIIRRDLLLRWDLPVSADRQAAAVEAEEEIRALRDKKLRVLAPDGTLPSPANRVPRVQSQPPTYGLSAGITPTPPISPSNS